jgi:death-on-curing protein
MLARYELAGHQARVRDIELLDAARARHQATLLGVDAYPDLCEKAAALLHSIARNHAIAAVLASCTRQTSP